MFNFVIIFGTFLFDVLIQIFQNMENIANSLLVKFSAWFYEYIFTQYLFYNQCFLNNIKILLINFVQDIR